eukprot:15149156-Alexandrium_andersonii.AAC.1
MSVAAVPHPPQTRRVQPFRVDIQGDGTCQVRGHPDKQHRCRAHAPPFAMVLSGDDGVLRRSTHAEHKELGTHRAGDAVEVAPEPPVVVRMMDE